jgi:hypothetical protein
VIRHVADRAVSIRVVEKGLASVDPDEDGNASQRILNITKKLLSAGNGLKLSEFLLVAGAIG